MIRRLLSTPFATNMSLVSVPIGLLAVAIGPAVSRSFTILFPSQFELIYIWGVAMIVGGATVAYGILRNMPSVEMVGLTILSIPYGFYGAAVIVALGPGGLVTGPFTIVMAASCLMRARNILLEALAIVRFEAKQSQQGTGE